MTHNSKAVLRQLIDDSEKRVDLIPLGFSQGWRFDLRNIARLRGGHGEEIVRSIAVDDKV